MHYALHKKDDKLTCDNFRAISVLLSGYKIIMKVLYNRLLPHAEMVIGYGVVSTVTNLLQIRSLISDSADKQGVQNSHLFIDFKSAYDIVKRSELYVVMQELSFEPKLIQLLAMTINRSRSRIRID